MSWTDLLLLITLSVWNPIKPQTHQLFLSVKRTKRLSLCQLMVTLTSLCIECNILELDRAQVIVCNVSKPLSRRPHWGLNRHTVLFTEALL